MSNYTRRRFLQQGLVIGAGGMTMAGLVRRAVAVNERINVACIGLRGRGNGVMHEFAAHADVRITHVCDIDKNVLDQRAVEIEKKTGHKPTPVKDYRAILDDKDVHAITLGTPDHWHALPTIHACMAGKDVYVEKPDGHNIAEGRAMVDAARKYGRMVQMGTQLRSAPFIHEAAEYVRSGALGKIVFGRSWETEGKRVIPRVPDSDPPAGVDYDLWLGPAPKRPFNSQRFHGNWRWFFDYGSGDMGNDGVHRMDYCRMVMGIDTLPKIITCTGGKYVVPDDAQDWPDTQMASFDFGGQIITYEMRIGTRTKLLGAPEGAAVYGESGWVLIDNRSWTAYDEKDQILKQSNAGASEAGVRHARNFLDAMRSRKHESLHQDISSGHVSSVMCHAANIAWRTGLTLHLNTDETFAEAEANKYRGRENRKGFELPTIG